MRDKLLVTVILAFMFALVIVPVAHAENRVVINSEDWQDVYSGLLYASLEGYDYHFLTSTRHGIIIAENLPSSVESVDLFSSSRNPFITGYIPTLEDEGVETVDEIRSNSLNLDVLERLPDIDKFIVIDDTYGYNAVSVAPYAVLGDYYVLLADETNIDAVADALDERDVSEMIIYGHTDRDVRDALEQYSPEVINTGDRFENNMQMVDKYQELHTQLHGETRKQAILTNGEFLEASIFTGSEPVLFIGFSNVPDHVRSYIEQSDLEVGTLVGNELIGTATFVRRETGLSVFVKFGQGSRDPSGAIAQVEDLDRFPIPRYELDLDVVSAVANTASQELEVTYENKAPVASYFRNILLRVSVDGDDYVISDDARSTFIDGNSFKTLAFSLVDGNNDSIDIDGSNGSLEVNTIYGESPRSLEQSVEKSLALEEVSVLDETDIAIEDVSYSKLRNGFLVEIENTGTVDSFVVVELIDMSVGDETVSFSSDPASVSPDKTSTLFVPVELTDEDVSNNNEIDVRAYYGERENSLIKRKEAIFQFEYANDSFAFYVLITLTVALLLLFFWKRKCPHCGHKNPAARKTCKRCKKSLKRS